MQTQYWISSLKINLKSKNHILGEDNFCQQSILHMGCIKSVTANNQCLYCSSDNVWTMSKGGEIDICFIVDSLTNLVPPRIQVILEWLNFHCSAEPEVDLLWDTFSIQDFHSYKKCSVLTHLMYQPCT